MYMLYSMEKTVSKLHPSEKKFLNKRFILYNLEIQYFMQLWFLDIHWC
jgi:hypothetical protein